MFRDVLKRINRARKQIIFILTKRKNSAKNQFNKTGKRKRVNQCSKKLYYEKFHSD